MTLRSTVFVLAAGVVASTIACTASAGAAAPATDRVSSASVEEPAEISFGDPSFFRMKRPGGLQGSGDFDQDGDLDLVSVGTDSYFEPVGRGYITVYAGDGAGGFKRAAKAEPDGPPALVRVGDMNNDGDLDLVIASNYHVRDHTISVYLGRPGLEFSDPITENTRARVLDFELGDLDGDGDLDVVMNSYNAEHRELPPGVVTSGSGDEDRELTPAGIFLLENVGDGRLDKRPDLPFNTLEVELGDVNEDGRLDIVAYKLGGGVAVVLNDGEWSFTVPTTFPYMGKTPDHLRLRDLDADGHLDLSGDTLRDGVNIRYGLGDGTFGHRNAHPDMGLDEIADIDGDGLLDIVQSYGNNVGVFVAERTRSYASLVLVPAFPQSYLSSIADVDSDGSPDFLLTTVDEPPHQGAAMLNTSTD